MDDVYINVGKLVNTYLGMVFKAGLAIVTLASLFLLTNLTTEFYETPKFLVLLLFTLVMLILLTLKYTLSNKVIFTRTPLDIPLLLLLAVAIVSTILAPAPYVSLLGNQLKVHGSLVSIVVYILFYFVLVNSLKTAKEIKWVFILAVVASQILAAATLLSYIGIKVLPAPWQGLNFTPTGSSFSTTAVLALLMPFIVRGIVSSTKPLFIILNSLFLVLSGLAIALTGMWATWIGALAALVLSLAAANLGNLRNLSKTRLAPLLGLVLPLVLIALITTLSYVPPIGGAKNPFYSIAQNFPREIQASFTTSWKVSVSAFRDLPFWGTGPSTYLFNFTSYKPVEFNSTKLWNLRFDTAFNEYLQTLGTLGGVGLLALLSLTALFVSSASSVILSAAKDPSIQLRPTSVGDSSSFGKLRTQNDNKVALAISGLVFFIILALHPSTLPFFVFGLLVLASFMVINLSGAVKKLEGFEGNIKDTLLRVVSSVTNQQPSQNSIHIDALPGILLTIAVALTLATFYFGGKFALADYHHRLALNAVSQNLGVIAYNELVAAEKLNPYNDLYRTDLAQTNFALANAIASAKGPTEASPSGSLTEQDKQNIQVLLQQSINEGRNAVALNPRSAANWEVLALLYRQISGVAQNALLFSLDSYGRAIFQDPLNPLLRTNVGGVYYAVKNYDMAIRFFTDAINLKPDFANGYFNLSVALKDKGDLAGAQAAAEQVLKLVDKDSQDYKTASDYLEDLKKKIAEGEAAQQTQQGEAVPPAAKESAALEKKELPKVISLPKPEKIATPEAVKKPEASAEPSASPETTPIP